MFLKFIFSVIYCCVYIYVYIYISYHICTESVLVLKSFQLHLHLLSQNFLPKFRAKWADIRPVSWRSKGSTSTVN